MLARESNGDSWEMRVFDQNGDSPYDEKVGFEHLAPFRFARPVRLQDRFLLLPPRSMVGHLPLEQVIGVRIPGGQPIALHCHPKKMGGYYPRLCNALD